MDSYFREAFESLQACAKHLMAASQETNLAGAELVKATGAALHAKDEHEDLRETITRLETTVLDQVKDDQVLREEVRQLRAEVRQLRDDWGNA